MNDVVKWEERLAAEAKAVAANFRPSVGRISLRAGVMAYEGNTVPGNTIDVIVLASVFENALYNGRYDPNNLANPDCFALSTEPLAMVPDPMVPEPPSTTCATCPNMEWGSDPNGGRGKACKQVVRLALLPVGNAVSPEAINNSELATLRVSVTNVKEWGNYVQKLSAMSGRPPWSVVTSIKVVPDPKRQFRIIFEEKGAITDNDVLNALYKRTEMGKTTVLTPYDSLGPQEEAEEPAESQKTGKKKKY
jgi:hypothetical protein